MRRRDERRGRNMVGLAGGRKWGSGGGVVVEWWWSLVGGYAALLNGRSMGELPCGDDKSPIGELPPVCCGTMIISAGASRYTRKNFLSSVIGS